MVGLWPLRVITLKVQEEMDEHWGPAAWAGSLPKCLRNSVPYPRRKLNPTEEPSVYVFLLLAGLLFCPPLNLPSGDRQ